MNKLYLIDQTKVNIDSLPAYPKYFHQKTNKLDEDLAWRVLYSLLYKENIQDYHIAYQDNGKPYLLSHECYFNISHSGNMLAVMINDDNCSVDIEKITERTHLDELAKKILNSDDYQIYLKDYKHFFKIWTLKEAYYKLDGVDVIRSSNYQIPLSFKSFRIKDALNQEYYVSYYDKGEVEIINYE